MDLQEKFNNMGITQRTLLYTAAVLLFFVALMFDVNTNYIIALILYFLILFILLFFYFFSLVGKNHNTSIGNNYIFNEQNPTHIYQDSGTYDVMLKVYTEDNISHYIVQQIIIE